MLKYMCDILLAATRSQFQLLYRITDNIILKKKNKTKKKKASSRWSTPSYTPFACLYTQKDHVTLYATNRTIYLWGHLQLPQWLSLTGPNKVCFAFNMKIHISYAQSSTICVEPQPGPTSLSTFPYHGWQINPLDLLKSP